MTPMAMEPPPSSSTCGAADDVHDAEHEVGVPDEAAQGDPDDGGPSEEGREGYEAVGDAELHGAEGYGRENDDEGRVEGREDGRQADLLDVRTGSPPNSGVSKAERVGGPTHPPPNQDTLDA